jgi:lysozyme family protein
MFRKVHAALLGLFVATASAPAFAQVDVSGAVTEITDAATPITSIGIAVVALAVIGLIFKMIRRML